MVEYTIYDVYRRDGCSSKLNSVHVEAPRVATKADSVLSMLN